MSQAIALIESQICSHRDSLHARNAEEYRRWLTQGYTKGLRALFRAVSKHDAFIDRPFDHLPFEARPAARREYWVRIWGHNPSGPVNLGPHGADLRARARQQTNEIPPIKVKTLAKLVKRLPKKAGMDLALLCLRLFHSRSYNFLLIRCISGNIKEPFPSKCKPF